MNKKEKLLNTAAMIENTFKEVGNDKIKATVISTPYDYIQVRNEGVLIVEISKEDDWVVETLYPVTLSLLNKIIRNLD